MTRAHRHLLCVAAGMLSLTLAYRPSGTSRQMWPGRLHARLPVATSRVLIVALVVSLFPLLPASPALAVGTDLAHTPPTGWTITGYGNPGLAGGLANLSDANDATQSNIDVGDGQGCTAVTTTVRDCAVAIIFARTSGVTSFQIQSFRVKFAYCVSGWPDFNTCTSSNTGISVSQLRVQCEENFAPVTHRSLSRGWNGISDTTQVNLDTPCTIGSVTGGDDTVLVVMRINRNSPAGGSSVWWSLELYDALVPNQDAGSEQLGRQAESAFSPDPVNLATGNFLHQATDLALAGRLLSLAFTRYYNSADTIVGSFGPGWTHSFNWSLTDAGDNVDLRRGDGRVDRFGRQPDLSYAPPFGVFDALVKNGDATYTLTLTDQTAFTFSSAGGLTRISEPAGNHIDLAYTSGNLTTITDTVGRSVTLHYDGASRLDWLLDPIGRKVTYAYDDSGRLATVTDKIGNAPGQTPSEHQWHYAYDGTSRHLTTITDPDGRVSVTNTYDAQGRVYQQRDGLLHLTTFAYNTGQTVMTDPRSTATTYVFDDLYREVSESVVVTGTTRTLSYTYDGLGNRDSVTDRNGTRTDFTYDARGNLLTKLDPQVDPQTPRYLTTYEYDLKNNLWHVIDARAFETTSTFDPGTNLKVSTSRQITTGPATYAVTKWEYADATNPGLPTKIISPRGNTGPTPNYAYSQTLVYWPTGELKEDIDADGSKTTFGYDGVSRPTTMVDADGYAPGGVPAEHTWTTVYDENSQVKEVRDPLVHSTLDSYDGAGNRKSVTDRNGNVTSYAYDGAARLFTVKQKPDPVGQPTLEYTTSVIRDNNGNVTQVTQANGVVTDYTYDELNRLISFTTHPGTPPSITTSYVLDGNGNATTRTTGDGVATTYMYDPLSRVKSISALGLTTITYDYDELSHRKQMVDGPPGATDGTGTSTYSYDGLGRLTQAVQPNGTLGYGYDLDSNRTTLTYPSVGSVTYVFSPAGRLSSLTDWGARQSTYTYTATGLAKTVSVPGGLTTTYTYDEAQRLRTMVNATGAGTITSDIYTLDNEGNRVGIDELLPNGTFPSAKVNTDAGTTVQDHPAIAIGNEIPAPATYLIWDDARDGNANIYFSRRDPVTGAWSTPNTKVNSDTGTRVQVNPAISTDSASNAYAVWEDSRDGANNKIDTNIYASTRTAADGLWGTNRKVNDDPTSQNPVQRNPRVAGTAAGIETAVWVDLRSSQNNIYASQLNLPGCTTGLWCPNKKITDNTSALKDFPDVAVDVNNTAYAVWQDSRGGNADIFFSSLTHLGANWSANVKISDDAGSAAQTKPRIGVDSAGNLTAAWIDARTSPPHVRVARKPAGGAWTASIDISPTPANVQSLSLSVRPDGFAWAVWGDTRAGASNQDIWGSRYDPSLNRWSAPLRLDDDPGTSANQLAPAVAFGPAETMLTWRDNRFSANGDTQARRILFIQGMTDHFALTYDGLNRLKSIVGPVSESFALDGASNVSTRSGTTELYDGANRLTDDGSTHNVWSNADRLSTRGTDSFTYDALDRLTGSTVAGTGRIYTYNGEGLLQTRTGGVGATFLWDPSTSPSRELKQNSDNIVYGLGPLYVVRADATTLTFARDGGKSVRAEVNSAGSVTATFRYRVYGQVAQSTGAASPSYLGYAGQLFDVSGLYYMRARWYDPTPGRFVTRDPLLAEIPSPMTMNPFNYAGANPALHTDPFGLRASFGESSEGGTCDAVCVSLIATSLPPWDYTTTSVSIGPVVVERSVDRFGQAYYAFGAGAGIPPVGLSVVQGVMKDRSYSPDDTDRFLTGPAFTAQIGFLTWGQGVAVSPLANNSANESGFYTPQVSVAATWGFREADVLSWRPFPWPWQ